METIMMGAALAAPVLLLAALAIALRRRARIARSAVADAVVIAAERSQTASGVLFFPVVEFRTADGRTVRFTSKRGSANEKEYFASRRLQVLYERDAPENAIVRDFRSLWLAPIALAILGAAAGFAAALWHL